MEVINNSEKNRFEIHFDNKIAFMDYTIRLKKLIVSHTEVPVEFSGQGFGKMLVKYAIDFAEKNNLLIIPTCSFIEKYLDKHPEYNYIRDDRK